MATPVEQAADRKTASVLSGGPYTVTKPTNLVNGNVIVIWVLQYDNGTDVGSITGFNLRAGPVRETTSHIQSGWIFDRVVDGTEGASFTVSGLSQYTELIACRLTGCATGGGFQTSGTSHGVSAAPAIPSIVTTNTNNLALLFHGGDSFAASGGAITNWTALLTGFDGGNDLFSRSIPTATTTSSPASYSLGGSEDWTTMVVVYSDTALAVATTAPPPPPNRIRRPLMQRARSL